MLVYDCSIDVNPVEYNRECHSRNMPDDLKACRGGTPIAAWATGAEV